VKLRTTRRGTAAGSPRARLTPWVAWADNGNRPARSRGEWATPRRSAAGPFARSARTVPRRERERAGAPSHKFPPSPRRHSLFQHFDARELLRDLGRPSAKRARGASRTAALRVRMSARSETPRRARVGESCCAGARRAPWPGNDGSTRTKGARKRSSFSVNRERARRGGGGPRR